MGRFAEADGLREQLCHFGFFVRDEDRANQQPGYFVICSDERQVHITDRGWVPTYSLMQQHILRQCSLDKVLTWMFGNSENAGIDQFSRQTEHPTLYAKHRAGNRYVCEGRTYAMRLGEEDDRGAEERRYAPRHPRAVVRKGEGDTSRAPGSAEPDACKRAERRTPAGEHERVERGVSDVLEKNEAVAVAGGADSNSSPGTAAAAAQHGERQSTEGRNQATGDADSNRGAVGEGSEEVLEGTAAHSAAQQTAAALLPGSAVRPPAAQTTSVEHGVARSAASGGGEAGKGGPSGPMQPPASGEQEGQGLAERWAAKEGRRAAWESDSWMPQIAHTRAALAANTVSCVGSNWVDIPEACKGITGIRNPGTAKQQQDAEAAVGSEHSSMQGTTALGGHNRRYYTGATRCRAYRPLSGNTCMVVINAATPSFRHEGARSQYFDMVGDTVKYCHMHLISWTQKVVAERLAAGEELGACVCTLLPIALAGRRWCSIWPLYMHTASPSRNAGATSRR